MPNCPDRECHDKVVRCTFFMKIFGGALGLLVLILLTVGGARMESEKTQNKQIAEIPVIQKDIEHIKVNVKRIDTKLDNIEKERKEDVLIIHKRITTTEEKILKAIRGLEK